MLHRILNPTNFRCLPKISVLHNYVKVPFGYKLFIKSAGMWQEIFILVTWHHLLPRTKGILSLLVGLFATLSDENTPNVMCFPTGGTLRSIHSFLFFFNLIIVSSFCANCFSGSNLFYIWVHCHSCAHNMCLLCASLSSIS